MNRGDDAVPSDFRAGFSFPGSICPCVAQRVRAKLPGQTGSPDRPLPRRWRYRHDGAPLTRDERVAIRAHLNPHFCEYYASTEGGGVTLLTPADIDTHADTVGPAVHGVEVQVVDEAHERLPPGEVGRLRYRSPGCATGFYLDPHASVEAFRDGWFYPGDLVQLDTDGLLTLAGRAKDMIIRGGINIYPEEIEATLMAHPAVADAAVIGLPYPARGEEAAAFAVLGGQAGEMVLRALVPRTPGGRSRDR